MGFTAVEELGFRGFGLVDRFSCLRWPSGFGVWILGFRIWASAGMQDLGFESGA